MNRRFEDEDHWNRVDRGVNTIIGIVMGVLIGGSLGLGICMWVITGTLLFPGDTVLAGALLCGFGGFWYGEPFIDWLKENWWWFS